MVSPRVTIGGLFPPKSIFLVTVSPRVTIGGLSPTNIFCGGSSASNYWEIPPKSFFVTVSPRVTIGIHLKCNTYLPTYLPTNLDYENPALSPFRL